MRDYRRVFSNLTTQESGQDLIEYALVTACVALVATASLKTLGANFLNMLTNALQIIFSTV